MEVPLLRINSERFLNDIHCLAQIGATADGGVCRLALSPEDVAGRAWFEARVQESGLEFKQDGAGNISAQLPAANPDAQTLLAGSHLDTVFNGGRFDGALGALAALEALRTIKDAGIVPPMHLEAISFTDEEGSFFSILGSQAMIGALDGESFANPRGGVEAFEAGLARLGLTTESILSAKREPHSLCGFVEVHVEQGTRLEGAGLDIGVVTGIVGIRSAWVHFYGQAAHAGTMPLAKRKDALWGASEFVQRAKTLVMDQFTPGVMNCGQIEALPGAFNIVPAEVRMSLEFRNGSEPLLDEMAEVLFGLAEEVAEANGLDLKIEMAHGCIAAPSAEPVMGAIELACEALGLKGKRMLSLAGHDTQALATVTPSGMIFVPSVDGISHNPNELTHDEDLVNGANVLLHTLLNLMNGVSG